jgi:hypothetical protein
VGQIRLQIMRQSGSDFAANQHAILDAIENGVNGWLAQDSVQVV